MNAKILGLFVMLAFSAPAWAEVVYREVFNNDSGAAVNFPYVGWTSAMTGTPAVQSGNGVDPALGNNSGQSDTSIASAKGWVLAGGTRTGLLSTTEYTGSLPLNRQTLHYISLHQSNANPNIGLHIALRFGTDPGAQWFYANKFPGHTNSGMATAERFEISDFSGSNWTTSMTSSGVGVTYNQPLPQGNITAFGVYVTKPSGDMSARFDNFEIAASYLPPPPAPGTTISVETAPDGSGALVPPQNLYIGSSITVYAISRAADGSFLANVSASWQQTETDSTGDLVPATDGKSAIFTGRVAGTATIGIAWNGLTSSPPPGLPTVTVVGRSALGQFSLTGSGIPWQDYDIATSSDLLSWRPHGVTKADAAGTFHFSDQPGTPQQFYRLRGAGKDSGAISILQPVLKTWSATPSNYLWETNRNNWTGADTGFTTGNAVTFTDEGSDASPIQLVGSLSPASVTIDTSLKHYIFSGSGHLTGSGGLIKLGTGHFTIATTSPNTYTGPTLVQGGTLEIASALSFATPNPSPIGVSAGATLFMNDAGANTWTNNVSGGGTWKVATGTGSEITSLTGDYRGFTGTLILSGGATATLAGSAKYPAAEATLHIAANATASLAGGGTFESAVDLFGGVTGEPSGQLRLGTGIELTGPVSLHADTTLGVDAGNTATLSGGISGNHLLTKLGAGTLAISGSNSHQGNLIVAGGSLLVNGTLGQSDRTLTVQGNNSALGGNGTILSAVHVASDATLAPGAGGIGTLNISNSITLSGNTSMELSKSTGTHDELVATGNITFDDTLILTNLAGTLTMGDSFKLFTAGSFSGAFTDISPATPGAGLIWDTSSLAEDGTVLVMGENVTTSTFSYAGYTVTTRSRFRGHDSLVKRASPNYDYSVNLLKVDDGFFAVTGGRYNGEGEDGDHIFGWSSTHGQPGTWKNTNGSGPLFLKKDSFGANTMDPEVIFNPANSKWYMYVQKQRTEGDRILALTSSDLKNWTRDLSWVIDNFPSGVNVFLHHHEVIYVPWANKPFWMYFSCRENGVIKGYKLIKSSDPKNFDYATRIDCSGERNLGGQRGYLQEAKNGPLFVRITSADRNGKTVPVIQLSDNGTAWTYTSGLYLAGSSNTGDNKNCYFPGISTINGNGALEQIGPRRWRALYAASTSAGPTAPEIYDSEIGVGEVVIDLNK